MADPDEFSRLTPEDVARLLRDPSDVNRARIARKVGISLGSNELTANERAVAEEIVRVFARDAIAHVRIALAESVKSTNSLPRDVAQRLARDVAEVAIPVVQFSRSLTDEDLIEIVRNGDVPRQMAVAGRAAVSAPVAESVLNHAAERAVIVLLENKQAEIGGNGLEHALERFAGRRSVIDAMALRDRLPAMVAKRLVELVSESLQTHLVQRYDLAPSVARKLMTKARGHVAKTLYPSNSTSADPLLRARELKAQNRLNSQVVLRALCHSDVTFFEASLAVLAKAPLSNVRVLAHDPGPLGLRSLLLKANIPSRLLPIFRVALAVATELDRSLDSDAFLVQRRLIAERIIETYADSRHEDADNLLSKLDNFAVAHNEKSETVHFAAQSKASPTPPVKPAARLFS